MALSGAEKVRRQRARKRAGEAVLPVRCNVGAVADWLIDHGMLQEWDSSDRDRVRAALDAAITVWSRYETV
jgi:hypothetical protein